MVSRKLDIPLLPQSTLLHLRAEGVDLRVGGGCRILEDVRHRSPAERVDDAVDHRSHRLAIRPTLLQPVKDLLFTRLPDCNQVLVDQPVQGRRYTRVRNLSRFEDLVVNCPRRRGAEIPNGPEDREFQLSKFHADYYMHSNLIRTCRWLDSSQARAAVWVAVSENRFARMSNAATRTAFVLRDPSVSNSITMRVGSLPALTDSTLYRSMNFLHVLQSLASSRVSSSSVAVDCMWLSQKGTSGSRARRWAIVSSRRGRTLSYSLPSSARIGPRWNSTSSIAIFGTSATRTRRKAFAYAGSVSSISSRIASGAADRTLIFISDPPPPAASLRLRAVVRDRGHFLDPPDAQSGAGGAADGRLGPGTRGLRTVPARSAHADVDRIDALLLRGIRHAFRGLHRRVRRRLVLRRLHDHPAGRLRDRLGSGQIGQGDDDVVVRRVDVRDPPSWHGSSLRLVRGRCSRLVTGQVGPFLALGGDRPGDLALLADRMEVARDRGPLVVRDPGLLRPADEDAGVRNPPASDRHMAMDDELPRSQLREREALVERERQ